MDILILWMLAFPLIGAIANGLIIRSTQVKRSGMIATLAAAGSFVCALILSLIHFQSEAPLAIAVPWFQTGTLNLEWGFRFDALTVIMSLVVSGIGTLIHLFSIGYMDEEATPYRYFAYLNLFLFSMLILITGDNLPVMFVGWEGVGLCSYLLIGYWYQDLAKSNAGMKAFIVNRIGDAGFLIGMFLCFELFGSLNFQSMAGTIAETSSENLTLLNWIGFCLFIGAMGKSAQIPLYVWLPDAMAGPTPVSALIHAATMVTAGVYLIVRMSFLFSLTMDASHFVAVIGGLTALFAATIAVAQRDIKKVLAYSTVSQLGFMFLAAGVGAYAAAVFHLMTHAFFKALLFLAAGSIIHGLGGEQDICKMGGLKRKLPWTFATFTIGWLAICGIPPLSGFFSKDAILWAALASENGNPLFWALGSVASLLTAFYMSRLYFLVFFGEYRGEAHPHESPMVMTLPLVVLAVGSAVTGFLGMPHPLPNFMEGFLEALIPTLIIDHHIMPEPLAIGIAVAVAIAGVSLAAFFYMPSPQRSEKAASKLRPIQMILSNKYWVDEFYDFIFVRPFHVACRFLARVIDTRVIDGLVLLPTKICRVGATTLSFIQGGSIQFYLWSMLIGGLLILWFSIRGIVI